MGDWRSKWMNRQQQQEHLMCTNSKIIKIMLAEAGTLCGDDGVRCMHTQRSEYHNITMLAICWVEESKLIFSTYHKQDTYPQQPAAEPSVRVIKWSFRMKNLMAWQSWQVVEPAWLEDLLRIIHANLYDNVVFVLCNIQLLILHTQWVFLPSAQSLISTKLPLFPFSQP